MVGCVKQTLTTPGDKTKIRGVLVVESSITDFMSRTGGSTNLKENASPKLTTNQGIVNNCNTVHHSYRTFLCDHISTFDSIGCNVLE